MKIDIMQEIMRFGHATKTQKSEASPSKGFGKILEETIKTSSNTNTGGPQSTVMEGIQEIQMYPMPALDNTPVYEGTERLLDTLDEYRQRLADREVSLREIDPLISKIAKESKGLTEQVDALSEGDPLKEIVNQTLIVSSLEVMKFTRGDYNVG
ncbi:MAG: hypothetical protein JRL30_06200 [Deltaproteobacteria bacterium]|nr:hypothetical protein [Deltaproteobacteria bacterium]